MNGTMPTIILNTTLYKLHCIELSFARWEPRANQLMLHQNSSKYTNNLNLRLTGKAYFENPFSHF